MFSKENVEQALKTKIKSKNEINKMQNILYKNYKNEQNTENEEEKQEKSQISDKRLEQIASNLDNCTLNDFEKE